MGKPKKYIFKQPRRKNVTFIPLEIKREKDGIWWTVTYSIPPKYTEDQVILSENTYGIVRQPIPDEVHRKRVIDIGEIDNRKTPYRLKVRQLSGRMAIIYALVNPIDSKIFYIGSTKTSMAIRLHEHIFRPTNDKLSKVIRRIRDNRKNVIVAELCKVPCEFQFDEEFRWIKGAAKKYPITNKINNR